MSMSKRNYQAIARAIYATREMIYRDPSHDEVRDSLLADLMERLAGIMAADNPRFDRGRFIEACETGDMREPHRIPPMPICAQAMGCLCAGHARNPRRKTCDTREIAR